MPNPLQHPIIDCHVHAFDFEAAARGGFASLRAMGGTMDECGYGAVNVMSLTSYRACDMAQNPLCLLIKALHPGRAYAFGSLYYPPQGFPDGKADFRGQAERLVAAGCDGMKMIEGKPDTRKRTGIPLDSTLYDDYYGWLQETGTPLLYHVGDPASFWDAEKAPAWAKENGWFYGDDTYIERDALFSEAEGILIKFPLLKMIFAHFYFMSGDVYRASAFLDKWPNVCFDITPNSGMFADFSLDAGSWRAFFIRYRHRILYGTDDEVEAPRLWAPTAQTIRRFLETGDRFEGFRGRQTEGICLPEEALERIYYRNFQSLAGAEPKRPDVPAAVEECRRLAAIVPNGPDREKYVFEIAEVQKMLETI